MTGNPEILRAFYDRSAEALAADPEADSVERAECRRASIVNRWMPLGVQ